MLRELYAILFKQHDAKDAEGAKYSRLGTKGSALFLDYSLSCFRGLVYLCVSVTLTTFELNQFSRLTIPRVSPLLGISDSRRPRCHITHTPQHRIGPCYQFTVRVKCSYCYLQC